MVSTAPYTRIRKMASRETVDGPNPDAVKSSYLSRPVYKETPIEEDYVIHWPKHLGTGVSGPVRECTHIKSGQKRALKILRDREKSYSEISLHWKCSGSKHVVRIVDIYVNSIRMPSDIMAQKKVLVVMDLMKGGELFQYIYRNKKFTEEQARRISVQIGEAIRDCHSNGIAHRDLKPENLLLEEDVSLDEKKLLIKLSDFGFAKIDNGDMKTPQFTPYYVAPQILKAQEIQYQRAHGKLPPGSPYYYDKSCDMWSFGVILYIMLCGYPPFYSEINGQPLSNRMKNKILAGEYTFPREAWKNISDDAKDLIEKLLAVEPSERLTISEFFAHSWIKSLQNEEQKLPSPENYNAEQMELYKQAHTAVLAEFRRGSDDFQLLPTREIFSTNPIAQRRNIQAAPKPTLKLQIPTGQQNTSPEQKDETLSSPMELTLPTPPLQETKDTPPLFPLNGDGFRQKLKNVIDMCMMPPPHTGDSRPPQLESSGDPDPVNPTLLASLEELIQFSGPKRVDLVYVLTKFSWNGTTFVNAISMSHLGTALETLL